MQTRRWLNQSQPQTLLIACMLLYFNAALALLSMLGSGIPQADRLPILVLVAVLMTLVGGPGAAYGMANERKWGYLLGIAVAATPFVLRLVYAGNPFAANLLELIFEIALFALLVHPQSREYQRIWFK